MTHTLTCPECSHVFPLEAEDFDQNYYEDDEPIVCPNCSVAFEWDFDEDREPQLMLTEAAEEAEEEVCETCGLPEDECDCDSEVPDDEETEDEES